MDTTTEWLIDDQTPEYQAAYWRIRAERAEKLLQAEKKRKAPEYVTELEQEIVDLNDGIRMNRADAERWQKVGEQGWARVVELESEGAAPRLKREATFWHEQWRRTTKRLGDVLEHVGLLEEQEDAAAARLGVRSIRQSERRDEMRYPESNVRIEAKSYEDYVKELNAHLEAKQ